MERRRLSLALTALAGALSLAAATMMPSTASARRTIEGETTEYLVITLTNASVMR